MSLKPDDFPINDDGTDAFLHGVVITFDGKDEWSLYDDPIDDHEFRSKKTDPVQRAP